MSTKDKILKAAKDEFFKNGYKKTSLRTIATNCDMTTGAIYNIFHDKADLFDALVKDEMLDFVRMAEQMGQEFNFSSFESKEEGFEKMQLCIERCTRDFFDFYYAHRDAVLLAFFHSEGSSYEGITDYLLRNNAQRNRSYYEEIVGEPNFIYADLLRVLSETYIELLCRGLLQTYTREELKEYMDTLIQLYMGCFRTLCENSMDQISTNQ